MTRRQFSNTATEATLTGGIAAADTSFALTSFAGYPAVPFTATISRGAADEEIILVTAVSASTVTATRGYDGTTSKSHAAGSTFEHTTIAKDFDEANAHVNQTTAVHGIAGAVVGTTDVQTLTNKTLTSPVLAGPSITGTAALATATVSGTLSVTGVTTLGSVNATSASVAGSFGVSGVTTLAALTAGATTLTQLTVSGASTFTGPVTLTGGVAGALTATGAVSGTTVTGSALVKGAGLETTQALTLAQIATPVGVAGKDTFYAKADGGVYVQAGTGGEARIARNLGSGTSVPGSGMFAGDTYDHNTAGVLIYDGAAWVKASIAAVVYKNAGAEVSGTAAAPPRLYLGKVTATFSAVSFSTVTFDYTAAGFTEAPTVQVTPEGGTTYDLTANIESVTSTSVSITVRCPVNITANVAVHVTVMGR